MLIVKITSNLKVNTTAPGKGEGKTTMSLLLHVIHVEKDSG